MTRENNKDRIINASLELFNQSGTVAVTTNHIADHLMISPGNLYFHYRGRNDIVRQIFNRMCKETYQIWYGPDGKKILRKPEELVQMMYDLFFKYRFLHREMYHLRRQDRELATRWKKHIKKVERLFFSTYAQWVRQGWMKPVTSKKELQFIGATIMNTAHSFLNFFESSSKPARSRSINVGVDYVLLLLGAYKPNGKANLM